MMITMNDTTRNRFYKSQEDMYEQEIENGSICFKGTGKESGIGKTEVARILHKKLAADEPMIKINFGNYSAQDALNSLIGRIT